MGDSSKKACTLNLWGGRLCLDFANTADWHGSDHPVEYLTNYAELVLWSNHAGILTEKKAKRLLKVAVHCSKDAAAVLKRAIGLREVVYRIFTAISHGKMPQVDDLAIFNTELSKTMARSQILVKDEAFTWNLVGGENKMDQMLWPVVHDAAGLLTSKDRYRVGKCMDDKCGWLFLDTSRNRSRRWCSMKDCGNRAKARQHYKRSQN